MLDPRLVEQVADDLGTSPALVEKDWHVVRALGVIAPLDGGGMQIAFSGGTSLSKGWDLIKRFSEDIDFKVREPAPASRSAGRKARGVYRQQLLDALTSAGFTLERAPEIGNDNRFFAADLGYRPQHGAGEGLRPHLRIEVSFHAPALPPVDRPLQSLLAKANRQEPEVAAFPCVDIVETAADKLSALAWRVRARTRGSANDDPTIIRHLHDLAALEDAIATAPRFRELVLAAVAADAGRGGEQNPPTDPAMVFDIMLKTLANDPLWAREYEQFVAAVSFAPAEHVISFRVALDAVKRMAGAFRDD
ncbi:MAG: nucleotidyl transferase AbiEii/AbiGii toxin family protein [Alphaproteobacteria bacterium]|nr:nucleotidyl transferase AbiEii/AbiGii toxin family protein [Alphaproteobacteria bacterium]